MLLSRSSVVILLAVAGAAQAHIAPWVKGMWCLNGTSGTDNPNTNEAVQPLYNLPYSQWWMHAFNGCNLFPPAPGDFLNLPAGGTFNVEMSGNRGQTTLSFGGQYTSDWPDGLQHPDDYSTADPGPYPVSADGCLSTPNFHTTSQSDAAGSVFAISYTSDITKVTPQNLVVFTVAPNTPWKRIATFSVPSGMAACPSGGCICVWGWVPNNCGTPNMYMLPYRCKVSNPGNKRLAPPKAPVWCEGNPSGCVTGAKQMIFWNQAEGNNLAVSGTQADGLQKSPGYNSKTGFSPGAQNDIFRN
ncbi:hypothetical protein DL93DRAFT_2170702 [Clavulina sp. PMI_390]|nr:hypothetical protein DL93DRAFT_2170702 [Clavulina sp. PMI_390]